jgi:hypothetical protein
VNTGSICHENIESESLHVYDSSINSSYFANGLTGQLSVRANISTNARIQICYFTNETNYQNFIDGEEEDERGDCSCVLEVINGTKQHNCDGTTKRINNSLPGYYFIGLKIEKLVDHLCFNFTAERTFYNRSDFEKIPNCEDVPCIFSDPREACIMLHAEPMFEPTFSSLQITGQSKIQETKIALIVFTVAIFIIVIIIIVLISGCLYRHRGK